MKDILDFKFMKQDVEKEIKEKKLESINYGTPYQKLLVIYHSPSPKEISINHALYEQIQHEAHSIG